MRYTAVWCMGLLLLAAGVSGGCARAARSTEGFAISETASVNVPFQDAWQMTKAVLREQDYDLYTRDTRGVFVAFSGAKRNLALVPKRIKYTIALEPVSDTSTQITVEVIRQVYGVTLLTYPGWHDRKATDATQARAILDAIQAKASGAAPAAPSVPANS